MINEENDNILLDPEALYRHGRGEENVSMSPEMLNNILHSIREAEEELAMRDVITADDSNANYDKKPLVPEVSHRKHYMDRLFGGVSRQLDSLVVKDRISTYLNARSLVLPAALVVVSLALTPFLIDNQNSGPRGMEHIAGLPTSLMHDATSALEYIDPNLTSGSAFAGSDAVAIAFRLGSTVTDLLVSAAAIQSAERAETLSRVEKVLRELTRLDGEARIWVAAEQISDALNAPVAAEQFKQLAVASDEVRAALEARDPNVVAVFDLGRDLEAIRLGVRLAIDGPDPTALEGALASFAESWGSTNLATVGLAAVRDEIDELLAQHDTSEIDPYDIDLRVRGFRVLFE